jgi:hypothetical protein
MDKLEVHLGLEVSDPIKISQKKGIINDFINDFTSTGAKDVILLDSYYIQNETPNRPKVFKIVLSMKATLKDLTNIFEDLTNLFHSSKKRLKIFIYKNKELFAEYVKNSESKGVIKILSNENINNFNIHIIHVEYYKNEFN